MKRMLPVALLALALIAGGGWLLTQPRNSGSEISLPGAAVAQVAGTEIEVADMYQGDVDAPIEVIEYASFTCPHCANFHATVYDQLKENYIDTGKVKFTYREVYFDKYGMWGSMIARCEPTKFFGIADMLYDEQADWSRAGSDGAIADGLRKIGLKAGIGKDQLDACLGDGDKLKALVGWYQENATRDEIESTPSFLIDGKKYSNMNYADFSAILDEKLAE
ncbi:DsbA family protein [Puniceibacterium sediminis]|uniref:Thioredoxin n=1 Tax=Puniceibacterium sediminis TaxID=1608407 RepID=A0A238VFB9_9RHOB|nr:DsbA family protein [Puniceibacterium sediminis]SNR32777.1 Thioredoxin [Puniceibacterium sediminis]